MTFSLPHAWVWDFWTARDGDTFHLYYLHAPKSLGDPELRHRNAAIGHATSVDLVNWADHGVVLEHGAAGDPDATATWTGSVLRDPSGLWRMYYTGSRFLRDDAHTNVETVLMATSTDLRDWTKEGGTSLSADSDWYETLPAGTWHEEAWRDPWIAQDARGGWHMLVTARSRDVAPAVDPRDRGVIGHVVSADLVTWRTVEPLSAPGEGFAHLEVLQLVEIDGRQVLLFSCDTAHLAGARAGERGGVWAVPVPEDGLFSGPLLSLRDAHRVTGDDLYAGRAVLRPNGEWALLGFENIGVNGVFVGRLSDPVPLRWDDAGRLVAQRNEFVL
ncbi:glycoside hydrolase family protein [Herbiconiux ginsengi]|uniref:beta-fructofuranosidase n=1 Tax=Herbiconiux ginsengi TaxID=381665 RepID=A0A1H3MSC9_9MICO|nr:glycosyl hydrolase family 32 [Herbiconiux ginsengi]SDY79364.1 beta-fructofuranosidase [Herbiconiux ginsengi]